MPSVRLLHRVVRVFVVAVIAAVAVVVVIALSLGVVWFGSSSPPSQTTPTTHLSHMCRSSQTLCNQTRDCYSFENTTRTPAGCFPFVRIPIITLPTANQSAITSVPARMFVRSTYRRAEDRRTTDLTLVVSEVPLPITLVPSTLMMDAGIHDGLRRWQVTVHYRKLELELEFEFHAADVALWIPFCLPVAVSEGSSLSWIVSVDFLCILEAT